ncbi:MAG: gliding motility-associated C-terminal domain-containing protein [Bacteroidaceae bacterium]|nr:gliding motility-associated C-terminal domain-containing protein [Bacteroidaceae bacterium]
MMKLFRLFSLYLLLACLHTVTYAQDATPTIVLFSIDDNADVTLNAGESKVVQAPVDLNCDVDIDDKGYDYVCKWQFFSTKGQENLLLTRYETSTTYTLTESGGYKVVCSITFSLDGDTVQYVSAPFTVTISESSLKCPNGFSPNNDDRNDKLNITFKSIVKLEGYIFNRWGKKLFTYTLDNAAEGWDGRVNGKYVADGVYFLQLNAVGSDGVKYNIKKTINVLKGFNENMESSGATGTE